MVPSFYLGLKLQVTSSVLYLATMRVKTLIYKINTVESRYLEIDWTIFYKFKLTEMQNNLHFG